MDILWQTAAAVANGTTRSASTNQIFKVFYVPHAMEMVCLHKINCMNYITYTMKIRGLSLEDLCVEKYSSVKLQVF